MKLKCLEKMSMSHNATRSRGHPYFFFFLLFFFFFGSSSSLASSPSFLPRRRPPKRVRRAPASASCGVGPVASSPPRPLVKRAELRGGARHARLHEVGDEHVAL